MKRETLLKKSPTALKKYLWRNVFSPYIRQRDKGICFTCGKKGDWKKQHAGHFVHKSYTPIYFDETNVHCQCATCNTFEHGNLIEYTLRMIKKYGKEHVEHLKKEGNKVKKWKSVELVDLIEKYNLKQGK